MVGSSSDPIDKATTMVEQLGAEPAGYGGTILNS